MKKTYPLLILLLTLSYNSFSQVPTNGDCLGAIPVCQSVYNYTSSANGAGNYTDLPYQGTPSTNYCPGNCISAGESNSTWYIFTTQNAGVISFTINPIDVNDDYDWALYNLTTNSCSGIYAGGMQVSCNYCLNTGATGANQANATYCQGPNGCVAFNKVIPAGAGETYALMVNNFTGSFNGYSINFSGSTAGVVDNTAPWMSTLQTPVACGASTLYISFSENVRCSSVTGSDFTLTGPGGPYTISYVTGPACNSGGTFERNYTLTVIPQMSTGGTYTLWLSGAVLDNCANASNPADARNSKSFNITGVTATLTGSPLSFCQGGSTTLTAGGATTYVWSHSLGTGTTQTVTPAATTTYSVQGTTGLCASTATVTINVTPTPLGAVMASPINFGNLACATVSDVKSNAVTSCFANNYGQSSDDIYYSFTLPVTSQVNISHCGSGFDTYMYLLNSSGTQIALNDDNGPLCGGTTASMQQTLAAGTYYIVSEGYGGNSGNITTSVWRTPPAGATMANALNAGTLSCTAYSNVQNNNTDYCFANNLGQASDDIYYSFTLTDNTIVDISHCGSGFDTYMQLLNSGGSSIAVNDDGGPLCGTWNEASIKANLAAGTYYVVSEGYGSNSGNINTQIWIPTPSGGSISGASTVCYGTNPSTYTATGVTDCSYYLWAVPAGASIVSGQGTQSVSINWGTASSGTITCTLRNGPCGGATLSFAVTVIPASCWIGVTSTDWFTASNWCLGGIIPQTTTDVIIPDAALTPNDPNINAAGAVCRNFTMQAGSITNISGSNPLSVYGNWSDAGVFNESTGIVNFVGSVAQQITSGETFYQLNINNAAGVTINAANTVSDRLILTNGTLTHGANLTLANNATIERFTGSLATAPAFGANVNLIFRSAVTTGPEIPVSASVLRNLELNTPAAGIVTLNSPATLNNQLLFTSGVMRTSAANLLTFADNSTYSGAANNRFIDGPVSKTGDDPFEFPTGDIAGATWVWAPIAMADPGANTADRFTATYYFTSSPNNWAPSDMCNPLILDHTSGVEYWDIQRVSGSIYPDLTLYWKDAARSGITSLPDLTTAHYESCSGPVKWVSKGGTAAGTLGVGGTGQITGSGFTSYSPVTFGAKKGTNNPLPVSLMEFAARCTDRIVHLSWSTASETNNDHFTIERSPDLNLWDQLAIVPGAGNSNTLISYSYLDENPYDGTSYYRLSQTDYDGHSETFAPVVANCITSSDEPSVSYYPNPFTDEVTVVLNNFKPEQAQIVIYDVLGNIVFDQQYQSGSSLSQEFKIDLKHIASGMYFIDFISGNVLLTQKIVKNP
jgi:hypothetical protein